MANGMDGKGPARWKFRRQNRRDNMGSSIPSGHVDNTERGHRRAFGGKETSFEHIRGILFFFIFNFIFGAL